MKPQKNIENTSKIITVLFICVFFSASIYLMYIGYRKISNEPMESAKYITIGLFIFLFILISLIKLIFKKTIPKKLITLYLTEIQGNRSFFINNRGKIISFNNNKYAKDCYYVAKANNYEIEQIIEPAKEVFTIKENYFGSFYFPIVGPAYGNMGIAMIYFLFIFSIVSIDPLPFFASLILIIYDFLFKKRKNSGLSTDDLDASALKTFNLYVLLKYAVITFILTIIAIAFPPPFNYFIIPFIFILLCNIIVIILEKKINREYSAKLRKYLLFINNEGPIIIFLVYTILSIIFKSYYGILFTFPFWVFIIYHIINWIKLRRYNYIIRVVNKSLTLLHEKEIITCDYENNLKFVTNNLTERFPILVKKHCAYFEAVPSEDEIYVTIIFKLNDNIKEEYKEKVDKYFQEYGYNIYHNKNIIYQKLNKSIICQKLSNKKNKDIEFINAELIQILKPFITNNDNGD